MLSTNNDIKALLGREWGSTRFVESQIRSYTQNADMQITELHLVTQQGDKIPATFVQAVKRAAPGPAILYCHAHGNRYDIGKREILDGRKALIRPYAHDLVALGYQVLCIDMPCFGERQHLPEAATAKACFWFGDTLYGWMLSELIAGVSYLSEHPDVDANRIASFGISMGGTHAWWLSALDERIRASVALCCFADLACLVEQKQHDIHGIYMSVPGLLTLTTTAKLAARACPRAQFFGIGL
ncbi:MAG: dienelactone hydrolase family protein, partial [Granulosicoccus sp.]